MARAIVAALVVLALVPVAPAQVRVGKSGFGGGFRPGGSVMPATPQMPAIPPPAAGLSGGFAHPGRPVRWPVNPGFPAFGFWPGFGGWGPGYGPSIQITVPGGAPSPSFAPTGPPELTVELSGEMPAILVLEFPAPAEVWVNGAKGVGEPQSEWTLTSPPIHVGSEYSFSVKARWTANGRTFEHEREVSVAAGTRSRSLVLSGREIKE